MKVTFNRGDVKEGDIFRIVRVRNGSYRIQIKNLNDEIEWQFMEKDGVSTYVHLDGAKNMVHALREAVERLEQVREIVEIIEI